jgi:sRNA-binding protein
MPGNWRRYEVRGRPDDREFIMTKEKQENDHPAALGMIEELSQRYPKTFTHEPHDVRPLARGIREAIVADAPDLPASIVSQALAIYAAWLPYMHACIAGAPRIDLSGDPAGVVTEEEAMYAVQRLAARERKRDERRAEREAAVRKAQEAGERPRQAAERGARSVKGEAVTVKQVIIAAKAETAAVERVAAKAEATTAKQAAATGQVTAAIKGETATRQDPAKAGPERLGLAGLKAAAQRRRLAALTS